MNKSMILPYACDCGHQWTTAWDGNVYCDSQKDACPKCDTMCDPDETRRIYELTPLGWFAHMLGEEEGTLLEEGLAKWMYKFNKVITTDGESLFFTNNHNKENN